MDRCEVRSHIAWLGRVTERCLLSAAAAAAVGDLASAADLYDAAEWCSVSAFKWARAL